MTDATKQFLDIIRQRAGKSSTGGNPRSSTPTPQTPSTPPKPGDNAWGGGEPNPIITEENIGEVPQNLRQEQDNAIFSRDWEYQDFADAIMSGRMPFVRYGEKIATSPDARINGLSFDETLRLARRADALNNRYYKRGFSPGWEGVGAHIGSYGTPTRFGEIYQMPISTQEQKEVGQARQLAGKAAGREIDRQQDAQDKSLLMEEAWELEQLSRIRALTAEEQRRYNEVFNLLLFQNYAEAYRQRWERSNYSFREIVSKLNIPRAQKNEVMALIESNGAAARLLLQLYNTAAAAPGAEDIVFGKAVAPLIAAYNRGEISMTDMMTKFGKLQVDVTAAYGLGLGGPETRDAIVDVAKQTIGTD